MQYNLAVQKSQYFSDYMRVIKEQNPTLETKEREWVMLSKFFTAIQEDLWDKGFSEEEYDEIIAKDTRDDVAYKFLAYSFLLIDEYESIKDLKRIINKDSDCNPKDFTKEDIEKIFAARNTVDY